MTPISQQIIRDQSGRITNPGVDSKAISLNYSLTLDELNRLNQLMGLALLNPEIRKRLLENDKALLETFHFPVEMQAWLLRIRALSLEEFAHSLVSSHNDPKSGITHACVKSAADTLIFCPKDDLDSPLQSLILVDECLATLNLPPCPYIRQIGLQHVLSQLISNEFECCCDWLGVPAPSPEDSVEAAEQTIRLFARRANPELLGWCWLFYRYVCVNLNASPSSFARMLNVNERTMRRYQRHAFRRLTEKLIVLEGAARRRHMWRFAGEG